MKEKTPLVWYRFFFRNKDTYSYVSDTYKQYGEDIAQESIEEDCKKWGRGESPLYNFTVERVAMPPVEWLKTAILEITLEQSLLSRRFERLKDCLKLAETETE